RSFNFFNQPRHFHWLGLKVVASRSERPFPLARHGVGREGNHRNLLCSWVGFDLLSICSSFKCRRNDRLSALRVNATCLPSRNVRLHGAYWRISGPFSEVENLAHMTRPT